VLAALLAIGFVLTLFVRPLRQAQNQPAALRAAPKTRSGAVAVAEPDE